jgi:acetyl esterase/lipase
MVMRIFHRLTNYLVCLAVVALLASQPVQAQNLNAKWSKQNVPEAPADLLFEKDLAYRTGHSRWQLNVIAPKEKSPNKRPAIVMIHGGGWNSNDHYRFSSLGFHLAREGYVVFAPTHRMIKDAPFPACLEDIKNVVRW